MQGGNDEKTIIAKALCFLAIPFLVCGMISDLMGSIYYGYSLIYVIEDIIFVILALVVLSGLKSRTNKATFAGALLAIVMLIKLGSLIIQIMQIMAGGDDPASGLFFYGIPPVIGILAGIGIILFSRTNRKAFLTPLYLSAIIRILIAVYCITMWFEYTYTEYNNTTELMIDILDLSFIGIALLHVSIIIYITSLEYFGTQTSDIIIDMHQLAGEPSLRYYGLVIDFIFTFGFLIFGTALCGIVGVWLIFPVWFVLIMYEIIMLVYSKRCVLEMDENETSISFKRLNGTAITINKAGIIYQKKWFGHTIIRTADGKSYYLRKELSLRFFQTITSAGLFLIIITVFVLIFVYNKIWYLLPLLIGLYPLIILMTLHLNRTIIKTENTLAGIRYTRYDGIVITVKKNQIVSEKQLIFHEIIKLDDGRTLYTNWLMERSAAREDWFIDFWIKAGKKAKQIRNQ